MNLWVVFLTGVTTGGLTCVAIQGGLLASAITNQVEENDPKTQKRSFLAVISFVSAKLIAYILLGFALGAFGSIFQLSLTLRIIFQLLASLFMLATAANLLELHPIFRYVSFQPPKSLFKKIKGLSKTKDVFTPGLLGLLTILLPCGTTIAMEVLAISSGNPLIGAATMGAFVLGTIPFFLIIGFSTIKLGELFREKFFKMAGALVLILGLWSLNGVLNLVGSPVTFETITNEIVSTLTIKPQDTTQSNQASQQEYSINILPNGYSPNSINVALGKPVKLHLVTDNNYSCTSSFVIAKFGISKQLPPSGTTDVEFTPNEKGSFRWTCGMGMYSGTLNVI